MASFAPLRRVWSALTAPQPPQREQRMAGGSMWSGMAADVAQWAEDDYLSFVKEGYNRNELAFSCVRQIATSASEARIRAVVAANDDLEEVTDTPLAALLERPNRRQSQYEFVELYHTWMQLAGNAYIFKLRGGMRQVMELRILRADRMRVVPGSDGDPEGYIYRIDGVDYPIAPDDVIHIKSPNAGNDWYGLSPLHVIAKRINLDANLTTYQSAFFSNAGVPAGILKFKRQLDEDEPEIYRRQMRQQFGGAKAFNAIVLGDDIDFQQVAIDFDKMVMPDLSGITEARICMAFQVPPILVGAKVGLDRATYSNYDQAFTAFWYGTVQPENRRFMTGLQLGLEAEFPGDWTIDADISQVRALQEDEDKRAARWALIFEKGGCTRDEFRTNVDLEAIGGRTGEAIRFTTGMLEMTAADIEKGGALQMDVLAEKGIAFIGEAREAFGMPRVPGDDIRIVSSRGTEQSADEMAKHELPLKPPNITFAITGPSVDALPTSFEPMFPDDAVAAPKPPPVLPPGFGGGPPQNGRPGLPPPNTPPELPAAQNRSVGSLWGIRAARTPRQTKYIRTLARIRAEHERAAEAQLDDYFRGLASRAAGIIGRSRKILPDEVRQAGFTPDDLVPKSADGQLVSILRNIALQTSQDVWQATNESGLVGDVDWDASHPAVSKLLMQAAGQAIDINDYTRSQLQQTLSTGYERGYTITQLADGVPDEAFPGIKSVINETYANRAQAIARTETMKAQLGSQVARYAASDVAEVEMQDGTDDEECAARDGQVVSLDEAEAEMDNEHPNGTLNFMPVFSGASDEVSADE